MLFWKKIANESFSKHSLQNDEEYTLINFWLSFNFENLVLMI